MIHYHGGPITPETAAWRAWQGRHAFISFAHPGQIGLAAAICQTFAIDCGAFTFWKQGGTINLPAYYEFCDQWLTHPACDWAIIPDVIGGTEDENDQLVYEWRFDDRGVPVWHTNESAERLRRLAELWPRVAIGSSAEFDASSPNRLLSRLNEVLPAILDGNGRPITKLHGLRMLNPAIVTRVPLSSADSTNVARNIGIDAAWGAKAPSTKETRALVLAERIESHQAPAAWTPIANPQLTMFEGVA